MPNAEQFKSTTASKVFSNRHMMIYTGFLALTLYRAPHRRNLENRNLPTHSGTPARVGQVGRLPHLPRRWWGEVEQVTALLVATGSASYTSIHGALQIPFVDALNSEAELEGLPAIIGLYNACMADVRINPYMILTFVLNGRGLKLSPRCISASRLAKKTIPTATPRFLG